MYPEAQFTFNLFDLIEFAIFLGGAFALYYKMDKRVSILEIGHEEQKRELIKMDKIQVDNLVQINAKLEELIKGVSRLEGANKFIKNP